MRYGCTETSFGDTSSSEIFLYAFHFMEVYFCCWKIMALPLTTSLAGLEAKASWASKAEAVTWHSHKPSSNLMSMARMLRLQSPVPGRAAHSYFPLYSPIGWKEIQKFRNRKITRFWCAFRWAIQLLLQKFKKTEETVLIKDGIGELRSHPFQVFIWRLERRYETLTLLCLLKLASSQGTLRLGRCWGFLIPQRLGCHLQLISSRLTFQVWWCGL